MARKARLEPRGAADIGIGKHLLGPYGEGIARIIRLEAIEEPSICYVAGSVAAAWKE